MWNDVNFIFFPSHLKSAEITHVDMDLNISYHYFYNTDKIDKQYFCEFLQHVLTCSFGLILYYYVW